MLTVFEANVRKVVIERRRYLPNTISLVVTFYVIFLAMFLGISVIGDPATAEANLRFAIVGNAFWFLLLMGVSSMGWELTTEATRGTLEQLAMSPVGLRAILAARMVGTLLVNLVITSAMLVLTMLTAGQWLSFDLPLLAAVLAPTFVAVVGLGYAVAGLALVFKQIDALLQVLQFVFLGFAFVPLSVAPWLELAPVVKGIDMIRAALIEGVTLSAFGPRDWASLVLNAAVYLALGLLAFALAERRARSRGLMGQY
ncbi:MAG: ABC transporter permease [Trueperaceae bacterium]|nr:MAG: ABC transporter permease [Trueperaceae bacterium]